jgi:hypothetical protein
VVLLQPRRAVAAIHPDRERVDPRPQGGHLTFGAALGGLQLGDAFVGQPQRGDAAVVVLVETDLAGVELTDAALNRLEVGPGLLCLRGGLLDAHRQPGHGLVDRLDPRAHRVDLPGQPRQPFAAVGLGAGGGEVRALGLGGDPVLLGLFGAGLLEAPP